MPAAVDGRGEGRGAEEGEEPPTHAVAGPVLGAPRCVSRMLTVRRSRSGSIGSIGPIGPAPAPTPPASARRRAGDPPRSTVARPDKMAWSRTATGRDLSGALAHRVPCLLARRRPCVVVAAVLAAIGRCSTAAVTAAAAPAEDSPAPTSGRRSGSGCSYCHCDRPLLLFASVVIAVTVAAVRFGCSRWP